MIDTIPTFEDYSFNYNNIVKKLDDFCMKGDQFYISRSNNLTVSKVEKQIKKFTFVEEYNNIRVIDSKCETRVKLPAFIYPLYYFLFFHDRLPSPTEFVNLYITTYFDVSNDICKLKNKKTQLHINSILSRLYRSYPSVIRDFHFYLLCKESNKFESVEYSTKTDYSGGMDIEVTRYGVKYPVNLMIDSKRSNYFKDLKNTRHKKKLKNEIVIKIPLNEKTEKMVGEIFLYGEKHLQYLLDQIENMRTVVSTSYYKLTIDDN